MPFGSCDCTNCPDGAPQEYEVTISGFANANCTQCTQLNGLFTLPFASQVGSTCTWLYSFTGSLPCGATAIQLQITGSTMQVSFTGASLATWQKTGIADCLSGEGKEHIWTLSLTSSS